MGNKIRMFAVILAVMLTAGAAGATSTITLGNTNTPQLTGIQVTATYDDSAKTISVQYVPGSAPVTNTVLGIDQVYYNLGNTVASGPAGWSFNFGGTTAGSFGDFLSSKNLKGSSKDGISSPIVFKLSGAFTVSPTPPPIAVNGNGATTAVHVRFSDGCSGWVSDGTTFEPASNTACSSSTQIPEFPNVALPIVSAVGLVFLFQYKKRKEK